MSAAIVELAVRHYLVIKEEFKDKFIGSSREFELELKKDPSDLAPEQLKLVNALFTTPTVGTTVKLKDLRYKLAKISKILAMIWVSDCLNRVTLEAIQTKFASVTLRLVA